MTPIPPAMEIPRLARWLSGLAHPPELYLVGGAVRDLLLGRPVSDLDLACDNAAAFAEDLARARNAALVPMEKPPHPTCWRVVDRADPADFVDLLDFRGPGILADLDGRDFTVNAMAARIAGGAAAGIVDPLGGRADLAGRVIRAVSERSLADDPLRVLRGFRFAASLDFSVDGRTREWMARHAAGLSRVAGERVWKETVLILETPRAAAAVRDMDAAGVLARVFPELAPMKGVAQNHYHHEDVWVHTLSVLALLERLVEDPGERFGARGGEVAAYLARDRRRPLAKLAALFHDSGKPAVRAPGKGRITFHGHERESEALSLAAARRLKAGNRDRDFWATVAGQHLHAEDLAREGVRDRTVLSWFRKTGPPAAAALLLASADLRAKRGPATDPEAAEARARRAEERFLEYLDFEAERRDEKPLVSGNDLKSLGIPPGPEMGRLLAALREAQDAGEIRTPQEGLETAKDLIRQWDLRVPR